MRTCVAPYVRILLKMKRFDQELAPPLGPGPMTSNRPKGPSKTSFLVLELLLGFLLIYVIKKEANKMVH